MTSKEIITDLKHLGRDSIKKVLLKHGAKEPFYGVKVEELKKIQKKIKQDYKLSIELFDSGISDAMYLAGLIADPGKMTRKDLQSWADKAYWSMLSNYTVAWVAAESLYALELALEWIDSPKEMIASAGWSTLCSYVAITPDARLDMPLLRKLAVRVIKDIHTAPNEVRSAMNNYLIATGSYVKSLTQDILLLAANMGVVEINMGATACKVPDVRTYIQKAEAKGKIGQKKKSARC